MNAICTGIMLFVQLQGVTTGPACICITPEERFALAQAVQGEVGAMGEHRQETGTWIVHVALNRVASPWFPDNIVSVVQGGFYGAATIPQPSPWAFDVVDFAVSQRAANHDPTQGALFVLGGLDILSCMDFSKRVGYLKRDGWDFSVHLFSTWPYPQGCWYD